MASAEDLYAEWSSGDPISTETPATTPAATPAVTPPIKAAPNLAPAGPPTTTPTLNPILSSDPTTPGASRTWWRTTTSVPKPRLI